MSAWISRGSIRNKVFFLAVVSAGVAALFCSAGFIYFDMQLGRQAEARRLEAQARRLAGSARVPLEAGDRRSLEAALATLEAVPTVRAAVVLGADGQRVAEFRGAGADAAPGPLSAEALEPGLRAVAGGDLEMSVPVLAGARILGTVYLRSSTHDVLEELETHAMVSGLVFAGSVLMSLVFSMFLRRSVTRPVQSLVESLQRISTRGDFSIRLERTSNDEFGELCGAVNKLLDRVHLSELALLRVHETLEERVRERTAQLEQQIAERERIEASLRESKDAAEAANRAKSEFLANMSHEIRTPLNSILGFTGLLRKDAVRNDQERRDFLETIHTSGHHLLTLINDILDLSKVESGKVDIQLGSVAPFRVVAEVASLLRVRAVEKGLKLDCRWEGPVPEAITSDEARLRQLLLNLVGNAVKFTEKGRVDIVARYVPGPERGRIQFKITDTGIGIPGEKLAVIFDPFVQADNSVTRRFGGTGLGLAICKRICEALGGAIEVRSCVDHGSQFTATVDAGPAAEIRLLDSPPVETHVRLTDEAPLDRLRGQSLRVLVVEDGDTNRKLISVYLRRAGMQVVTAENGLAGVEHALRQHFDVILMDMQMPVMDGYTAARRLRDAGLGVPIVALTAHAMRGDEERCREAGCSHYLTKPIDEERLLAMLAACVERGSAPETDSAVARPAPAAHGSTTDFRLETTLPMDDAEFREIVGEFIVRLRVKLEQMRQATASHNWTELSQLAHWLKGAGGTAGFAPLSTAAQRLEQQAKGGQVEQVERALGDIELLCERIADPAATAGG